MMSTATPDRRGARADRRWLVLVVVAVAQLMVVLDATVVNIALPSAQHALGFSNNERQWVVTCYALAFGSVRLLGGRIVDMFSRRRVFITGLAGFAVASAMGGASVSFPMLVTARTLQGVFGALLAPAALGTLTSTFTDQRERGRAFAVFGSVASGGAGAGLILGGRLTVTCLVVGPLLLAAFVAAARRSSHPLVPLRVILDRTRGGSYAVLGLTGIALFGVFLFLIYYLQSIKGYSPVTSGLLFLPFVAGILVTSTLPTIVPLPTVAPPPLIA